MHWYRSISRRRFLQLSALSLVAAACTDRPSPSALTSLGPSPFPSPSSATPPPSLPTPSLDDLPFSVWDAIRAALRTSPDHLAARADALVGAGDLEALFRFVRDEIATLPSGADGFGNAETAVRWGTRATMRCGAGTPREKVELLAELLRRAGSTVEVRSGQMIAEQADRPDLLYRPIARRFAPELDGPTVDGWLTSLGPGTVAPSIPLVDADGSVRRGLAGALRSRLPGGDATPFDGRIGGRVPIVAITSGGTTRFANPLVPDGVFGESYVAGQPSLASPPVPPLRLDAALLVARSDDPNTRIVVAEGSWTADQIVGRHIQVGFAPLGGPAALVGRTAEEVQLFRAYLMVRAPELSPDETRQLAAAGRTVSTGGRILDESSDGTPTVDGVPMGMAPPSAGAGTESIVRLDAVTPAVGAFPHVKLVVAPRDANGAVVTSLGAAEIRVEEEGRPMPFLLTENQPRRPRVLILLDTSTSIPAAFRGSAAVALGRQLASAILALDPAAQFRVGGINYGTVTPSGDWTGDPEAVAANVGRAAGDGSELWSALAAAIDLGPSTIVVITDGEATDPPDRIVRARPRVAAGPPVIVVGVGAATRAFGDEVALLTGGTQALASEVEPAVKAVAAALAAIRDAPYRLEYLAPIAGPTTRAIRVIVGKAEVDATYTVPAEGVRLVPTTLSGVYLRLRLSGGGEFIRTLGGLDHREPHTRGDPLPAGVADEVLGTLFGGALLSVEADGPTLAAWLDGFLAAKLTLRPVWAAIRAHDTPTLIDALGAASPVPPAALLPVSALLPGASDADSLTFPTGLRCALYREQLVFGQGRRHGLDLLPTARWRTATAATGVSFDRTLERTAHLAVAEGASFKTSTLSLLAGRPLQLLAAGVVAPRSGGLAPYARRLDEYSGEHRLVPADSGPFAFWVVRQHTGELLAILPDGTGGSDEVEPDAGVEKGAAVAGILGTLFELGFVGGAFIALQKAIARETLRLAAWILTIGDEESPDPHLGDPLKGLGCDLAKEAIGAMSHTFESADLVSKVIEAAGGHGIPCPG